MTGILSARLDTIADMQPEGFRKPMRAALQIGATLALARVVEMGGYSYENNVKAAVKELTETPESTAAPDLVAVVPPEAIPDELSPF